MKRLRLEYRDAAELKDNPANWRKHPAHQAKALEAIIDDVGCGYDGEHEMPKSWRTLAWKAHGGMGSLAKGKTLGTGQNNRFKERLWLSPHCLDLEPRVES